MAEIRERTKKEEKRFSRSKGRKVSDGECERGWERCEGMTLTEQGLISQCGQYP